MCVCVYMYAWMHVYMCLLLMFTEQWLCLRPLVQSLIISVCQQTFITPLTIAINNTKFLDVTLNKQGKDKFLKKESE